MSKKAFDKIAAGLNDALETVRKEQFVPLSFLADEFHLVSQRSFSVEEIAALFGTAHNEPEKK